LNPKLHLKSQIVDTQSGEIICGCGCGLVMAEKTSENKIPGFEDEKHSVHYKAESNVEHDKGIGSIISNTYFGKTTPTRKQQSEIKRLRTWQTRTRINNDSNRRLEKYFESLGSFENELEISWVIKNDIYTFLRRLEKQHLLKHKNEKITIIALVYLTKKLHGIPFHVKPYLKKYHYTIATYLKYIDDFKTGLNLNTANLATPRMAIMLSICKKLNIRQSIASTASSIVDYCVEKGLFISKQPSILAATCVYVVSTNQNENIMMIDVAEATGCSSVSIRNLKDEMKEVFEIFGLSIELKKSIRNYQSQERLT